MASDHYECKVTGMTFLHELQWGASYPEDFIRIQDHMEGLKVKDLDWFGDGRDGDFDDPPVDFSLPVTLFRDPDNKYDFNALEAHVPFLGRRGMIGHIPADVAAEVSPSIDSGDVWVGTLDVILVEPGHEDKPGAAVSLRRESRV